MQAKLTTDLKRFDWSQFHGQGGLRRVPAILILLVTGILCQQPGVGVLAAATALSTGFGATRQVRGSRLLAMVGTVLVMAVSALAGTLAGNFYPAALLGAGLWGLTCGLFTVLSEDAGWVIMQGTIALLVATAFPGNWDHAGGRALVVLLGGLTQILSLLVIWRVEGISRFGNESAPPGTPRQTPPGFPELWRKFRESLAGSSVAFQYAVKVGVTLMIAVEVDHLLQLKNGYWLATTTLVVLKPDFYRTYANGVQRVIGTVTGVLVASLIALAFHPQNWILVVLVGVFGFFTYALQKVNAVMFSAALTSYLVFLIAVTGLPEASVTGHRLINTCLGCALALISRFIGLSFLYPRLPTAVAKAGAL